MDNNNQNQNLGNASKPTYLSSENPDALANPDIKTTTANPHETATVPTSSPNGSLMGFEVSEPNPNSPTMNPVGSQNPFQGNLVSPQPVSQPVTITPQPVYTQLQQAPQPIVTQKEVIYREGSGGNFFVNIFMQFFNCFGCFLFIISVAVIVAAFWINF